MALSKPFVAVMAGVAMSVAAGAPASALTFNTTWAPSVDNLANAAQVKSAFQAATNVYQGLYTNNVTVNLYVGWGELLGSKVSTIGVAGMPGYGTYSYSQISTILRNSGTSATDLAAYASLRTASPIGSGSFTLTPAQAKAVGVLGSTTGVDGYIGFGANYAFDFSRADGIAAGSYDFMGVALHEISHVLGRVSGLSSSSAVNGLALDLFRYAAPGDDSFSYNEPAYFSIDGGTTNLASFNASGTADRDSWVVTPGDAFSAYATAGVVNDLSAADKIVMDVLGWNTMAPAITSGTTVTGGTTGTVSGTTGSTSTGSGGKGGGKPVKRAAEAFDVELASANVPEPAGLALFGMALAGLGLVRRRGA